MSDINLSDIPAQAPFVAHGTTMSAAALAARVAALDTELSQARALLAAVRPVVAASVAMDAARHDVMAFVAATNAHEAATIALPAEARAWAEGER